jgi:Co/Zn/Cd efflux system component
MNAAMFAVEIGAGAAAQSKALQADALDFLGDAMTYSLSLVVIGMSIGVRSGAALFKGITLGAMGIWVLGTTIHQIVLQPDPEPLIMGTVGTLALAVNLSAALLLFRFRSGDANVRSVWLCSRNDAVGNVAVVLAASGVWASATPWPDLIVAALMAGLFLHSAVGIIRQALAERRSAAGPLVAGGS